MLTPAGEVAGTGAMVDVFREMMENTALQEFSTADPHVRVCGPTGIVTYAFLTRYRTNGVSYRTTGRDLWVITAADGVWKAVWRTMADVIEDAEK